MAVLSTTHPTLLDLVRRQDPDGSIASVVEILNETNEILADMVWLEGNLETGHRTTVRTGIPRPTWRKLYGGVQPTKSTSVQVTDSCGMLENYAEVDKALADLNGNTAAFRLSEDRPIIEGFNQELAETLFFGDTDSAPEEFMGLAPRFNDRSGPANADNIIHGGSSDTDNASIWLVVWGPNTVHGIIPKGSTAGLKMEDKGQVTIENVDGSNGRMEAYRTHYRWDCGLTVRDWRYVVRIANIDKSLLTRTFTASTKTFATGADLTDLMFQALRLPPSLAMGKPCWYMSRDMATWVARQKAALGLESFIKETNVAGDMVWTEAFQNVPIRRVDALAADEALVTT